MPRAQPPAGSALEELDSGGDIGRYSSQSPPKGGSPSSEQLLAHLAELTDALMAHAATVKREYDRLGRLLEDASTGRAAAASNGDPATVESEAYGLFERPVSASPHGEDREGYRLMALNLALNGTPRAETARYLRESFGFDGDEILDEAYGDAGIGGLSRSGEGSRGTRFSPSR